MVENAEWIKTINHHTVAVAPPTRATIEVALFSFMVENAEWIKTINHHTVAVAPPTRATIEVALFSFGRVSE